MCVGGTFALPEELETQVFGDASPLAYGAVVYIVTNHPRQGHFLISKSRVAPIKKVTLPRLELLAALVGARLLTYVAEALARFNMN